MLRHYKKIKKENKLCSVEMNGTTKFDAFLRPLLSIIIQIGESDAQSMVYISGGLPE
jgi:hypothetical protein